MAIPATSIGAPSNGAKIATATLVETSGEYCQVNGTIAPVNPTAPVINFQVNLPTNWNHKSLHYGGGGFDGTLITGVAALDMAPYRHADAARIRLRHLRRRFGPSEFEHHGRIVRGQRRSARQLRRPEPQENA
nr:tannase/feruloyl esterase family alpha/beta hydrolase [Candidatus Burkholderia verschuerenii]